jgi:hypothetical protein
VLRNQLKVVAVDQVAVNVFDSFDKNFAKFDHYEIQNDG